MRGDSDVLGGETMDVEFILAHKHRLMMFEDLSRESATLEKLAKKNRITRLKAEEALRELISSGIVRTEDGTNYLTEKGTALVPHVRKASESIRLPRPAPKRNRGSQITVAPDHKRHQLVRKRIR